ncbi:MAG TPA: hypothetical protein VH351_17765 [Bryobacteraceae bacterium]|jgi:hypothetical protein|nr:hypothetical protein [Bryobacteraceae bacterium]
MLEIRDSQLKTMAAASPSTPMVKPCPTDATWIEVHLVDEAGNAVAGEKYRIRLPDHNIRRRNFGPEENLGRVG